MFLAIVTFNLNCLDRVVLAHPFRPLATFPVCFFVFSCRTNRAPSLLSSCVFLHVSSRSWMFQVTPIAIMVLHVCVCVCVSTFLLSALPLIYGVSISSPRESRCRCLRLFFFCCQLGYFSIHSTNAFTQTTSIKLKNIFDLVQVYSLTSCPEHQLHF